MVARHQSQLALASAFVGSASRYWLRIFPLVSRELHQWRERAHRIPDPALRRLALVTQDTERGNLEGAAAFAVLSPRAHRVRVVRAVVAFQVVYDYVDTLAELPSADPVANGRQLHLALVAALDPRREHADYYEYLASDRDSGYIRNLIDTCRFAFNGLPSHDVVAEIALRAAHRMIDYQALNHDAHTDVRSGFATWAQTLTPPDSGLHWWETAAGAASSLTVFALIAAAARPALDAGEVAATERAYFPWIGALHVLLDSLVDRHEDAETGQHCLLDHYASNEEAASRLSTIAEHGMCATEQLPQSIKHALLLAAMASFYLSAPAGSRPDASLTAQRVRGALGGLAMPTMTVLRTRRALEQLLSGADLPAHHTHSKLKYWTFHLLEAAHSRDHLSA